MKDMDWVDILSKKLNNAIQIQVRTPYTENWKNNQTAEWYASKKVRQ